MSAEIPKTRERVPEEEAQRLRGIVRHAKLIWKVRKQVFAGMIVD